MKVNYPSPWHKASFDKFLHEDLPALLAECAPLAAYHTTSTGPYSCTISLSLNTPEGTIELDFENIPRPDADGVFEIDGERRVIVPVASSEHLDRAEILCVGEQLNIYLSDKLPKGPNRSNWSEATAPHWLPLDRWFENFCRTGLGSTAGEFWWHEGITERSFITSQKLDENNWLAARTHLSRILIPGAKRVITTSQFGRTCPFETPEGPNIGHVLSLAVGAEIRDGTIQVIDDRPEATLGLSASLVPCLEHNDSNRQLMGVNMMRQWQVPSESEPALVQTGNEPDIPEFWCGLNLLTAFVPWGVDTFEDGIAISESAAKRFKFAYPIEPGDKLSNRHGTKGVISRILPDDEMPHLADGTPVELVFSFMGIHTRLNFGQVREAVLGRIANANGKPEIAPPFHAPKAKELRRKLVDAKLPEDGMERLTLGKGGESLARASTVGHVYWGRTGRDVRNTIHMSTSPSGRLQVQSDMDYYALRDSGAYQNIIETFNTRSSLNPDAGNLAERLSESLVEQADPPGPRFKEVARRLRAAGIRAEFNGDNIAFSLQAPEEPALRLVRPFPHPWIHVNIERIGLLDNFEPFDAVRRDNDSAMKLIEAKAPRSLLSKAIKRLEQSLERFFDELIRPEDLRFNSRVLFSGRSVIAPGDPGMSIDRIGLPEEMAWALFGPMVVRELGDPEAVEERSERASTVLDGVMERSWVVLNRAPSIFNVSFLAFRPLRSSGKVIRIHPLSCYCLNADFDGDQCAVYLPVTEAGQREAEEKLSIAGHLRRDPELISNLFPPQEATWGLAALARTEGGLDAIRERTGVELHPEGEILRRSDIIEAMRKIMEYEGVDAVLHLAESLLWFGLDVAQRSGASVCPFMGETLDRSLRPDGESVTEWEVYCDKSLKRLQESSDYDDPEMGPQLLAAKSQARGSLKHLSLLTDSRPPMVGLDGKYLPIRHGWSEGLEPEELFATVLAAREGLAETNENLSRMTEARGKGWRLQWYGALARAMRSAAPGVVFGRAAAWREVDPLAEIDSRLFVSLPPK